MDLLRGPTWDRIHTGAFVTTGESPGRGRQQGSQETNSAANQVTLWITVHAPPPFSLHGWNIVFASLLMYVISGRIKGGYKRAQWKQSNKQQESVLNPSQNMPRDIHPTFNQ